ncbi:hypothetical protein [Limosilactobacillus fermentum]|uniref:hypothetical protein n=1 Tax=Limosilactobacillus fermentum TaxID=1613 RepID=UPI00070E0208|nr:hypothetical protein [Limosilactobacillus fermentum]
MKSYYIESIDLWVLSINSVLKGEVRNAIAESFKKQSDKIHDVVVLDATVAPIEIISALSKKESKDCSVLKQH